MEKILISRCLMGEKVRYDGEAKWCDHPYILKWRDEGRLVFICPEVAGGLGTPRDPAEIVGVGGGVAVLKGLGKVKTHHADVTDPFLKGAEIALELAKKNQIKMAILKANSPSCGNIAIYDGGFSRQLIEGQGVTAALLEQNGVRVFNENQIELVAKYLEKF